MIKYLEYNDLFERFSIYTVDGKLSDKEALEKLKSETTPTLYHELEKFVETQIDFNYNN